MRTLIFILITFLLINNKSFGQWINLSENLPDSIGVITDIYFASEQTGLITCIDESLWPNYQRSIYKSSDFGENWVLIFRDTTYIEDEGYRFNFINSDIGFAYAENICIKTTNGGDSWTDQSLPEWSGGNLDILSIYFLDYNIGFAGGWVVINDIGNYIYFDIIFKTTDSGNNWYGSYQNRAFPPGVKKILFTEANIGYAANYYTLIKTFDPIENWFEVNGNYTGLLDFDFANSTMGWNINYTVTPNYQANYHISKTIDGGLSWLEQYDNLLDTLNCIYFIDSINGYCVGSKGKILKTVDGGVTWGSFNLGDNFNIKSIYFVNDSIGYCAGNNCLFKTITGGTTSVGHQFHHNNKYNEYSLEQNYPNPFNPVTTIHYSIPLDVTLETKNVVLKVYDILSNEVATLVNEEKPVGNYKIEFNALNLASGIYYYQLRAGDYIETKKMILLK
jgi:photosystem II stability/assembly factor-like uncharacterized protein